MLDDGIVYWTEQRPTEGGRAVVCKGDPHTVAGRRDPGGVRRAHAGARVRRRRVHRAPRDGLLLEPAGRPALPAGRRVAAPEPITPETDGAHRYADGTITPDGRWWIGVRERHDLGPAVADVVNELVVVPTDGSAEPRVLATGRDFYSSPRIAPDGTPAGVARVGSAVDALGRDRAVRRPTCRARPSSASPSSSRAGRRRSRSGIRSGARAATSSSPPIAADGGTSSASAAAIGTCCTRPRPSSATPSGSMGEHSIAFLSDGRIVCMYDHDAHTSIAVLDPETGELTDLDLPYDALRGAPGHRRVGHDDRVRRRFRRPARATWCGSISRPARST